MLKHMEKLAELKRAKLLALSLLLIAAAIFITTLALPPSPWVGALKAISEAAMVGALADWFAVVALFRRIPLPFVARHTAIIPRNKDRIADNLGRFVEEKFLDPPLSASPDARQLVQPAGERPTGRPAPAAGDERFSRTDR